MADMLLVILLDLGVEVLMSEKKTSSLVDDVRLVSLENRFALLRGSMKDVRFGE